jgi:WXG100 family type VII secretion target
MQVSFEHMAQGAQSIQAAAKSIEAKLDDLKRYLQPIVSEWQGSAVEAYQGRQAEWDQAAAGLFGVLHQIGGAVSVAGDNYHAAEQSNTQLWG